MEFDNWFRAHYPFPLINTEGPLKALLQSIAVEAWQGGYNQGCIDTLQLIRETNDSKVVKEMPTDTHG